MQDDIRVAMELQAQFDAEASNAQKPQSSHIMSKKLKMDNAPDCPDTQMFGNDVFESDEEYAALLAAAFEQEHRSEVFSARAAHGSSAGEDEDEKLARKLQEKWNGEDGISPSGRGGHSAEGKPTSSNQIHKGLLSTDSSADDAALHQFGRRNFNSLLSLSKVFGER